MNRLKLLILAIILFLSVNLQAQNASSREWTIFRTAVSQYQKANYEKALQGFSLMLNKLPNSALTTANMLMLAKTNYKMGNYQASLLQCEEFKKKYPRSSYLDAIRLLSGNNYYRLNDLSNAAREWLHVALSAQNPVIRQKAQKLADALITYKMNRLALQDLAQNEPSLRPVLNYYIAFKHHQNGNTGQAGQILKSVLAQIQSPFFKDKAEALNDILSGKSSAEIEIAALLPITGDNGDVGQQMLKGLQLAVDGFNKVASKPVKIHVYDYGSRMLTALELMDKIASGQVLFIFGPIENDITAACAAVARYQNIPLISPTATRGRINKISDTSILLAPSVETIGREIAAFAVDSLKLKRLVSLAPMDDYFVEMSTSFKSTVEALGSKVPAQEWYYPGDQNFKKQFRILKRAGLKLAFADSIRETQPDISSTGLDSLYVLYQKEQRQKLKETKTKLDSADIPVDTFDGFFLPLFKDDISYLASQYAYANFHSQLLGNADWYDAQVLKRNKSYIKGLIFASDGYLNEEGWDYRQFRNKFRTKFKKTPDRYAIIAYDSFNFIAPVLRENGHLTHENFIGKIVAQKPFQGIYRRINIDSNRENNAVRILKFIYGQIVPIR